MNRHAPLLTLAAVLALPAAACGDRPSDATAAPGEGGAVAATGTVIDVRLVTDEKGNYFEPAQITARPGDVLRLRLVSGVHNLSFPAEVNGGRTDLPAPTTLLQIAGQTVDVPVTMGPGEYVLQCDPHAPLGMVGTLTVR